MRTLVKYLLGFNGLFFVINLVMFRVGIPSAKNFTVPAQMIVLVLSSLGFFLFKAPHVLSWFGSKLEPGHDSNATVSYCIATFLVLVPTILNLSPLLVLLGLAS